LTEEWRPTCSTATLIERSRALTAIRAFFATRGVLEIDTPVLSQTTVTEPAIDSLAVQVADRRYYLQSSPEYHMKRLLAAGAPSIVRIGPVFRAEETGRLHNPEFTMVEWYRLDFDLSALMDEVRDLVSLLLGPAPFRRMTYAQLLEEGAGVDIRQCSRESLAAAAERLGIETSAGKLSERDMMDLLAAHVLDRLDGRTFVAGYPADQAALARVIEEQGRAVAQRFELIIDGVEIANGYDELLDAVILRERMEKDRRLRRADSREMPAADERLFDALQHGLPRCAGVALGFDRLLMQKLGCTTIEDVLPFSFARS
jgi:lysyl-tRNA synthetase class 2